MKHAARAAALAMTLAIARPASADDLDMRAPLRYGFAYTGITRAPAMSLSFGLEVDVAHITRRLSLTLVGDLESNSRPDLPDQDPLSSFGGFGEGVGLFYVTEGDVAFGLESTLWLTFDAHDLVGAGLATRAYVIPFYVPVEEAARRSGTDHFSAWVRSSLSVWVMARTDFTSDGNGPTIAFGASVDVLRIFFLPYLMTLSNKLR